MSAGQENAPGGIGATSIAIAAAYVDDAAAAFAFYGELLGLEMEYEMGPSARYYRISETSGLYVEGGHTPPAAEERGVRASFVLGVDSARHAFEHLRRAGVRTIQDGPMHMGGDQYWFQFLDPAGNIIEALGGE